MILPQFQIHDWGSALLDHLWQSTAVLILAWVLTLALRNNSARVRYWIWISASIKFLVPFRLLTILGSHWAKPAIHIGQPALDFFVEQFSNPLQQNPAPPLGLPVTTAASHVQLAIFATLGAVWLSGCVVLMARWVADWRRATMLVRAAQPVSEGREFRALRHAQLRAGNAKEVTLRLSPSEIEPGVFGIFRSTLLWPAELSERLNDTQILAIMTHEVEHVDRRDNLTCAIHAVVEALFWFHPLVRWMSKKMTEERERACDEKVIQLNAHPETYAESILKVCGFCLEPPTPCVAGVSGADLKDRILRIMTGRSGLALSFTRKLALSVAGISMFALPVGFGVLHGQSTSSGISSPVATRDLPKFEVATFKPDSSSENRHMIMMRPDGASFKGVEIQMLLQFAFGVEPDRIVGAPKWVDSNRYDVEAKVAPEDAARMDKLQLGQRREMFLPLLEERLHLKYHHETRMLPMYALVVARGGPKLTESKPGEPLPFADARTPGGTLPPPADPSKPDGPPGANRKVVGEGMRMSPGGIESRGGNVTFLSHALSRILGRTVVDKTGLTGTYDFSLKWTPDEGMRGAIGGLAGGPGNGEAPPDAGGPTLFTALQEQLGLKLESQKGAVDVIVIDHIDPPTEN